MQLNKVLQAENDRLKKDLKESRDSDITTFIWSWDMFQENKRLWEVVEGMTCPWYGPGIETFPL